MSSRRTIFEVRVLFVCVWLVSLCVFTVLGKDDITRCAVSEWTGRIALGSRVGAILLL